jgi:transcription-repair coupling factor (superfamily II helicase)
MSPVSLVSSNTPRRKILGLHGSAPAWFIADVLRDAPRAVIVCPDKRLVDEITEDLHFFRGGKPPTIFSPWETLPLEPVSPGVEISAQRIQALHAMRTKGSFLVVTSADALVQKVIAPDSFEDMLITLKQGGILHRDRFIHTLIDGGFRNSKSVVRVGEVSAKGSVIDFFPSTTSQPIRVQYDHDRIVRLQTFDPESQRSLNDITAVEILPVREFSLPLWYSQAQDDVIKAFKSRATETQTPSREVEKVLHAIDQNADYPGLELLQYIAAPLLPSFLDLIPPDTTVFILDKFQTLRAMEDFIERAHERGERLREEQHLIPRATDVYVDFDLISSKLQDATHYELATVADVDPEAVTENVRSESILDLSTKMRTSIGSGAAFEPLKEFLDQWRQRSYGIAFSVGSSSRAQRLQSILLSIGTDAPVLTTSASDWISLPRRPGVAIILGHLHTGFRLPTEKVIFVSENDVFGERSYRSGTAPRISAKKLLSSLSLLKEGDFIVHIDFGVGLYHGLKHITVEGILGDFLHIEYSDSTLYLPAHQIGKIQKFVATEGQKPHIDKLSSTRWARTKQKIRDSIVTLAGDLIRLYATRSVAKGWRYEPQGAEDERFADTFPFDETPDQRTAIEETLKDLAADKPMDRLVCGDVGFGKTEVAIRAAFKATQHARQVVVLVPTTILVEQHKKNFVERFAGYPVKIGAVSRFYPAIENQKTLEGVASGAIDIIIGTHRLLQHDVQFSDLGLLIIDEEHRFGVKQKERLRSYRTNVDVLTLTATPIPRTLHMSLLDIRDISLIHTAPVDRKVVHTYVAEKDDTLVRDAIQRELRRGGQVFYIHNRVQNIALVTQRLAEMVPEARFEFAHGQMTETSLERIMRRFADREIDVLVVTTIVESGLDVPNANTIIIDRADQFGLAQLYQLRGRVGRSKRQAFAYLLVPQMRTLSGEAHERLKVLQSLDALGVGFNLAIRDLEIRGAGNLLGKEQSGNVLSVGFDMYCRILQEAVADLKGDEPTLEDIIDPDVRVIGVEAFIPESYVPDIGERLVLYQRLSNIRSDEEGFDIQREIEDRFGPGSDEVENLFLLMRYRGLLRRHGVVKAEVTPLKASLTFSPIALLRDGHKPTANTRVDGLKALHLVEQMPHRYRFGRGNTFSLLFENPQEITFAEVYRKTAEVLNRILH